MSAQNDAFREFEPRSTKQKGNYRKRGKDGHIDPVELHGLKLDLQSRLEGGAVALLPGASEQDKSFWGRVLQLLPEFVRSYEMAELLQEENEQLWKAVDAYEKKIDEMLDWPRAHHLEKAKRISGQRSQLRQMYSDGGRASVSFLAIIDAWKAVNRKGHIPRTANAQHARIMGHAAAQCDVTSWVYFIQARACVKIGFAADLGSRFSSIQLSSPEELFVLGIIPGGAEKELELHLRFQHKRVRGEWFELTDEIKRFIRENCYTGEGVVGCGA